MTYLEDAAELVRAVAALTARLGAQAARLRETGRPADDAAVEEIEEEVDRRNRWLADRLLALAAIEAGLPPCRCHEHPQPAGETPCR